MSVADDIPVLAGDNDTAVFSDVSIAGRTDDRRVNVPLKTLGVIGDLHKAAAGKRHAGILAQDRRVGGGRLIALHIFLRLPVEQDEKFRRLAAAPHIIIEEALVGGRRNDPVGIDHVDLGNVVLSAERGKQLGVDLFRGIDARGDRPRQAQQVFVRGVHDVLTDVL